MMHISNEKIKCIEKLDCDEADLVLRFYKYYTEVHSLNDATKVFKDLNDIFNAISSEKRTTLFVIFSDLIDKSDYKSKNLYIVSPSNNIIEFNEKNYYAGKTLEHRLSQNYLNNELKEILKQHDDIVFVIDTSTVSTFPIWNTHMRRKAAAVFECVEKEQSINCKTISKIINNVEPTKVINDKKYELDFLIQLFKEVSDIASFKTMYILKSNIERNQEEVFFINEFEKFIYALNLKEDKYEYIYDTLCNDMDTMFSKYGFCNFKNEKCVSQRHKNLSNNYPTPSTDGCCFKVFSKCEHNNKDGTCKVRCLACKLFSCPYLTKKGIGLSASELILMRAFFNNKQKRDSVHGFFTSRDEIIAKIKKHQ